MAKNRTLSDYGIKPLSSPSESTATPMNKGKLSPIKIAKSTVKPGDSPLENMLEYAPGVGNFLSIDDLAIKGEQLYTNPNWKNTKEFLWEALGVVPFGKFVQPAAGAAGKLTSKQKRLAHYLDVVINSFSDGEFLKEAPPEKKAYGGVVLNSKVKKGKLMHQIEVDDEMQKFDGGTGKSGVKNPYKKVDAFAANTFRNLLPVPDNIAQMIAKTTFGDARMNNKSLSDKQKIILWNTIQNAKQRSGKDNGGTEYEDYGHQGYGDPTEFAGWFNRGKLDLKDLVVKSTTNPGFKLASTIGRGRYWTDPKDKTKIQYTDVYDWNPSEKNFGGKNFYQKLRNKVREGEDTKLDTTKNENYRMNFELRESEIDSLFQKHPDMLPAKVNNSIYNSKKATVQPVIKKPGGLMEQMAYGGVVALKSKVKNGKLFHQIEVEE